MMNITKKIKLFSLFCGALILLQGCGVKEEAPKYEKKDMSTVSANLLTDDLKVSLPKFIEAVLPQYKHKEMNKEEFLSYDKVDNMEYGIAYVYYYPQDEEAKLTNTHGVRILIRTKDSFVKPVQFSIDTNIKQQIRFGTDCGSVVNKNSEFSYNSYDSYSGDMYILKEDKYLNERCYFTAESPKAFYYEYTQIKYALCDAYLKQTNLS